MSSPFVAEIRMFGCNFAPKGWALCNGQILPISQNTALFSLLGTMYGGDGKSTFALPDMQGNVPLFWGQGPGLDPYDQGQLGGTATVTLIESEIPSHNHAIRVAVTPATLGAPAANAAIARAVGGNAFADIDGNTQMAAETLPPNGGSQPHNNMMPYLTVNFCIALQGVFPPRS